MTPLSLHQTALVFFQPNHFTSRFEIETRTFESKTYGVYG